MADSKATVGALKVVKALIWLVYAAATAAVIILAFAFFLLMFRANPATPFVAFIYKWGAWFSQPFYAMIPPTKLPNGGTIAWTALFAIAAYAVLAWLVGWALDTVSNRIWRDTHRPVVGQTVVTETHPLQDGGVVEKRTSEEVVAPGPDGPQDGPGPGA